MTSLVGFSSFAPRGILGGFFVCACIHVALHVCICYIRVYYIHGPVYYIHTYTHIYIHTYVCLTYVRMYMYIHKYYICTHARTHNRFYFTTQKFELLLHKHLQIKLHLLV
jgi:hypothetical protein